jgi:hypothetical protein
MKSGILAVSTLIGAVSLATASLAQDEVQVSRSAEPNTATAIAYGLSIAAAVPTLESARRPAGMLPEQPTGPVQPASGAPTSVPHPGGDLRRGDLQSD